MALQETLAQPATPRLEHAPAAFPALLKEADLESITLPPDSPVAGRLIRELELRTRTGASIVGIERTDGANIINPGPDEEVQAGDRVLLLGRHEQLAAARKHLLGES